MREREDFTIKQAIELREALSKKFGEEELKEVAGEFQLIRQDPESFQTLEEEEKRNIELFLAVMQITAPPSNELEIVRN